MATIDDLVNTTYQIFLDNGLDTSEVFKPMGSDQTTIGEALLGLLYDIADQKDYADWDVDSWKTAVADTVGSSPKVRPETGDADFYQSIDIFDQYDREEAAFVPGAEEGDREYLPWRVFVPPVGGLTVEQASTLTNYGETTYGGIRSAKPTAGTSEFVEQQLEVAEAAGTTVTGIEERRVSRDYLDERYFDAYVRAGLIISEDDFERGVTSTGIDFDELSQEGGTATTSLDEGLDPVGYGDEEEFVFTEVGMRLITEFVEERTDISGVNADERFSQAIKWLNARGDDGNVNWSIYMDEIDARFVGEVEPRMSQVFYVRGSDMTVVIPQDDISRAGINGNDLSLVINGMHAQGLDPSRGSEWKVVADIVTRRDISPKGERVSVEEMPWSEVNRLFGETINVNGVDQEVEILFNNEEFDILQEAWDNMPSSERSGVDDVGTVVATYAEGLSLYDNNREMAYLHSFAPDVAATLFAGGENDLTPEERSLLADTLNNLNSTGAVSNIGVFNALNSVAQSDVLSSTGETVSLASDEDIEESYRSIYKQWYLEDPDEYQISRFINELENSKTDWKEGRQEGIVSKALRGGDVDQAAPSNTVLLLQQLRSDRRYDDLFGHMPAHLTEEQWVNEFANATLNLLGSETAEGFADLQRAGMETGNLSDVRRKAFTTDIWKENPRIRENLAQFGNLIKGA